MVLRFGPGDAARCRFAISPLQETMSALLVLKDPARHGWYLPWLSEAQPVADALDLGLLNAVLPVRGYGPDFLWPSPATPLTTIEDDLAQVRATDPAVVATQLAGCARLSTALRRAVADDPAGLRDALAAQQQLVWRSLIAPTWDRLRGMLDTDITTRARQLADGGLEALVVNLHRRATWEHGDLHLAGFPQGTLDLRGRGMILVPTVFGWPTLGIGPTGDTSAPPALVYPMLGAAAVWEPAARRPAVARLLGAGRASVLAETVVPSTTGVLAQRVGLAPATVSQHLAVLRDAGLVTARRRGREVLYSQTPLAAALLAGSAEVWGDPELECRPPVGHRT